MSKINYNIIKSLSQEIEKVSPNILWNVKLLLSKITQESHFDDWVKFLSPLFSNIPNNWLDTIEFQLKKSSESTLFLIDELLEIFNTFKCEGVISFLNDNLNPNFSLAENILFYQNKIFQECQIIWKVKNIKQKEYVTVHISNILENSFYLRKHYVDDYHLLNVNIPDYIKNILSSSKEINSNHLLSKLYHQNIFFLKENIKEFFISIDLESVYHKIISKWNLEQLEYDDNRSLLKRWIFSIDKKYVYDINYFYQYTGVNLYKFLQEIIKCDMNCGERVSVTELIIEFSYSRKNRYNISLFDKLTTNVNTHIHIDNKSIIGLKSNKFMNIFDNNLDNSFINILGLENELDNTSSYFFYGNNSVHAENIIRNGINPKNSIYTDFNNHYFYLNPHFKDCIHYAKHKSPLGTFPTILIYKISLENLVQKFGNNFHSFDNGSMINGTWLQLVQSSWNSENKNKSLLMEAQNKSCIYGDQVDNTKYVLLGSLPHTRKRDIDNTFKQLSIGNDNEWFDNQLVAVILFDDKIDIL